MVKAGDTFLCSYPEKDKHLFIVVLDEYNNGCNIVCPCVMVTSWKDNPKLDDPACILNVGDHDFIKHKSYIAYKMVVTFEKGYIENCLMHGTFKAKPPVSEELLERIRKSAPKSRKISKNNLKYFK
mgnify:CR=1 FL=1